MYKFLLRVALRHRKRIKNSDLTAAIFFASLLKKKFFYTFTSKNVLTPERNINSTASIYGEFIEHF